MGSVACRRPDAAFSLVTRGAWPEAEMTWYRANPTAIANATASTAVTFSRRRSRSLIGETGPAACFRQVFADAHGAPPLPSCTAPRIVARVPLAITPSSPHSQSVELSHGAGAAAGMLAPPRLAGVSLEIGIVGLPNVGKSTLFNALTRAGALASNYPFATIEPNVGVVGVPDPRLAELAKLYDSARVVPASARFTDIAGLVRGASQGQGLGNQFLAHIRETDAICQVVRVFADPDVTHVDGD